MSDPNPVITQFMRSPSPFVAADATIGQVAQLMVREDVSGVPVIEEGEIVGIITEADLVTRQSTPEYPDPPGILTSLFGHKEEVEFSEDLRRITGATARDVMTSPVVNVLDIATMDEVATIMHEHSLGTIPVLNQDHVLVGLVSRRDIVKAIAQLEQAASSS